MNETLTDYTRVEGDANPNMERVCTKCGNIFIRPAGRGRPPKCCPSCRG